MIAIKPGRDWAKIRAEYIHGASQATLAKKYHVSRDMISRHCVSEGWRAERTAAKAVIQQKVLQKTADIVSDTAVIAEEIKREGLLTIQRLLKEFNELNCTEHKDISEKTVDIKRLRDLTAAYKDLTDGMKEEPQKTEPVRVIIDV